MKFIRKIDLSKFKKPKDEIEFKENAISFDAKDFTSSTIPPIIDKPSYMYMNMVPEPHRIGIPIPKPLLNIENMIESNELEEHIDTRYKKILNKLEFTANSIEKDIDNYIKNSELVKNNINRNLFELLLDTIDLNYRKVNNVIQTYGKKKTINPTIVVHIDDLTVLKYSKIFMKIITTYKKLFQGNTYDIYHLDIIKITIPPYLNYTFYQDYVNANLIDISSLDPFDIKSILFNLKKLYLYSVDKYKDLSTDLKSFNIKNINLLVVHINDIEFAINRIIDSANNWDNYISQLFYYNKILENILDSTYCDESNLILIKNIQLILSSDCHNYYETSIADSKNFIPKFEKINSKDENMIKEYLE